MMDDPVIKKIYKEFDQAEKALQKDAMSREIITLYKTLHKRTTSGEFSDDQLRLLRARSKQSMMVLEEVRRDLEKQAIDNSDRHNKIQSYLKNSF